jgi:hypothetical protein
MRGQGIPPDSLTAEGGSTTLLMTEFPEIPPEDEIADPAYRVPSILTVAFGAMVLVITGSWSTLVGRSATFEAEAMSGTLLNSLIFMNLGGPLIMVIGLALRHAPGSPVRQSLIATCLTSLWFYCKFMSGLFS